MPAYEAALEMRSGRSRRGQGEGDQALAEALDAAAEIPMDVAEQAAAVAELAASVAKHGRPELRADAIAAAELAAAASRAAGLLVEINLTVETGDQRVQRVRSLAGSARTAAERALEARD